MFEITPDAIVTVMGIGFYVMSVQGYGANGSVLCTLSAIDSADDNDRVIAIVKREDISIG